MPVALVGVFFFVRPIPAGDELAGDCDGQLFRAPTEDDGGVEELGVYGFDDGWEVVEGAGLEEEGVVVLEEEFDGEVVFVVARE